MQYFRDTETGAVFVFDDDVRSVRADDAWKFFMPGSGEPLPGPYPKTLEATDDPTPPPYVPTAEENALVQDSLLAQAAIRIAPLQDAVDLGESTAEESAQLLLWKKYRVALNRLDLAVMPVAWPAMPET